MRVRVKRQHKITLVSLFISLHRTQMFQTRLTFVYLCVVYVSNLWFETKEIQKIFFVLSQNKESQLVYHTIYSWETCNILHGNYQLAGRRMQPNRALLLCVLFLTLHKTQYMFT